MRATIILSLCAGCLATPAAADEITNAYPSIVRLIVVSPGDEDSAGGVTFGSGVAISPHKILTNAHVVGDAEYNKQVRVLVIPSEGAEQSSGKLVYIDPSKDLAIIEVNDRAFSPASVATQRSDPGQRVTALGYPGNVDAATISTVEEYVHPSSPIRSEGVLSGIKRIKDIDAYVHTATIARGNSGGPLVDSCGRVIGLNTFMTSNQEGDSAFAFAVSNQEISVFLRKAEESYRSDAEPCLDATQRARIEEGKATKERERLQALEATQQNAAQLAKAEDEAARADVRENRLATSAVLLLLALLTGGASLLLANKGKQRHFWLSAIFAFVLITVATVTFLSRPSRNLETSTPN